MPSALIEPVTECQNWSRSIKCLIMSGLNVLIFQENEDRSVYHCFSVYTILFRLVFEWWRIHFNLRFLHFIYPMDMSESRQHPFNTGRITNTLTCPWLLGKWILLCLIIIFLRILFSTVLPMSHKVYISYSVSLSTLKEVPANIDLR